MTLFVMKSAQKFHYAVKTVVKCVNLLSLVGSTVMFIPKKGRYDSILSFDNSRNCTQPDSQLDTNSPGDLAPQYFLQGS